MPRFKRKFILLIFLSVNCFLLWCARYDTILIYCLSVWLLPLLRLQKHESWTDETHASKILLTAEQGWGFGLWAFLFSPLFLSQKLEQKRAFILYIPLFCMSCSEWALMCCGVLVYIVCSVSPLVCAGVVV